MAHRVEESRSESGILIPNSFRVTVGCDVCRATTVERHVGGLDDALLAVRHLQGWLVASEGWRVLKINRTGERAMACPDHRKEVE